MPFDLLCCVRKGVEDIQELDYSHHSLTEVPSEVFVYERTLEVLYCQCNRINELPRQLFMCHGLKYLDLSDNDIQTLPSAVSSFVNLRHFNVSKNCLAFLPDTMKALKHLVFLDLSVNPLEKLPDALTNLISLHELYLNDTYLEYLPGNFGRLANLNILELRDNYLMILPKSLARLTELNRLDIGQNEFVQFPEVIGRFSKLQELWIDSNSLTSIPELIQPLSHLVHLEASNNMIEEVASEISFCTELVDISLSANNLTQLPEGIGSLKKLVTLKLDNNKLFELPESIGELCSLEELILITNYLDTLPASIGKLKKLQYLNIDENMIRTIPAELGNCSKLSVLSLRSNKLTSVPPELGYLSHLRVLNLVRNSLKNLPSTLLNCENLVAVWLSENQGKPLVPMHTETDPQTYEQVLTCYLFPQVPMSPVDKSLEQDKTVTSSKHISFSDMKSCPKGPEKPGQLRRAPTPYPKELRALAKHARSVNKENTQDISPTLQSGVHIKAAKITPTLQQRFASDNQTNSEWNQTLKLSGKESPYENNAENPYDKPLNLDYNESDKSYQAVDHELYPENQSINYNDHSKSSLKDQHYNEQKNLVGLDTIDSVLQRDHGNNYGLGSNLPSLRTSHASHGRVTPNLPTSRITTDSPYDQHPSEYLLQNQYQNVDKNYHGSVYDRESYALAKERMYGRRRFDIYNNQQPSTREHLKLPSSSDSVKSSNTMPNLSQYEKMLGVQSPGFYSSSLQTSPNSNMCHPSCQSPTYVKTPDLYSPTGHTNNTNPYRMSDTPLLSEDGSFTQQPHSNRGQNTYSIYEHMPETPPVVLQNQDGEPSHNRGQPPPYHVAAPFTKQAQYFNGAG